MGRFLTRSWILALPLAATAACHDQGAKLYGPDRPLAVGAYHSLSFGDACNVEQGFAIFCTTQVVTEIVEADTDDPSVAAVILAKDHPAGASAARQYYVVGKKAGHTSVIFKAMFDDGSLREDHIAVSVQDADTLRLVSRCGGGGTPSTNILAAVGQGGGFDVDAFAGKNQLDGWLPDALSAAGLTDNFADDNLIHYDWQAPATPVVLRPQSAVAPTVDGTLTAYGPDQVTEIVLDSANQLSPAAFTQPGDFYLSTGVLVHGQAPCQSLPVELRSATPSICSGPSGESVWLADPMLGTHATVHAEGACVLGAAMPGGPILTTRTFPIFFVQAPLAGSETPGFDTPCSVEGQTACAGYASFEVGVCQQGYWRLRDQCPLDQACDYVADSSPGCVAGTTCARCRGLR